VIGRAALPVLTGAVQLAAAAVVLGRPDLGLARAFLGTSVPTVGETLAALELLVWALVAANSVAGLAGVLATGAPVLRAARGRAWELSVAAIGLLLLTAGLAHHATPAASFGGGGSVPEAQQAIGR
jgi:hypothetical protein